MPFQQPLFLHNYMPLVLFCAFHFIFLTTAYGAQEQTNPRPKSAKEQFQTEQQSWVDTIYSQMSLEEKIGQLFMVMAFSNRTISHQQQIEKLINEHHIGGLIFMQGGPLRQAKLTNRYQSISTVPLLIATDAEYGLAMRLDSTLRIPEHMTMGAVEDERYVYEMARELALQLRRLGVHVNFAPVADVNVNPNNPVIGWRSFGEDRENVARKAIAYMKGLQHHGVIANAKHFPGHGDTEADSHYSLPVISHSYARLDSIEFHPFKRMIADTLMSVMIAHLQVNAIDSVKNRATTLSEKAVNGVLKDSLGFRGLIFTDALNMKGVADYHKPGGLEVQAIQAGNDILLAPEDVPKAVEAIKQALIDSIITEEEINESVKKILKAKFLVGLNHYYPVTIEGLAEELNHPKAKALKAELYGQAVTVAKNKDKFIPIQHTSTLSFASLSVGASKKTVFQKYLDKYASFEHHQLAPNKVASSANFNSLLSKLDSFDVVIVGVHRMSRKSAKRFGVTSALEKFIKQLSAKTKVIPVLFGNPYSLGYFDEQDFLVGAYENDPLMQQAVPQVLFGAITSSGRLPVSASDNLPAGTGDKIYSLGRMGYTLPESVGMNSNTLAYIDSIALRAIEIEATPGCQIVIAKNGKVVFEKAYGHHTYSRKTETTPESVYDLASLTKVFATLQAVMLLNEKGKLHLDSTLQTYIPSLAETNKGSLVIRDILAHQAGLKPFIPFWENLMDNREHNPAFISPVPTDSFNIQISPDLYATNAMEDSIWQWLVQTELSRRRYGSSGYKYRYSDLGFMLLKGVVEEVTGKSIDAFLQEEVYQPMGLSLLGYQPTTRIPLASITPTEMDIYYRKGLIHGFVHDPTAALQRGVAGHAGLFANAREVAILMQMNLQEGYYGGKWFLQPETVAQFNKRYFIENSNRRALGWDKPGIKNISGPTSEYSSEQTFGHTGFTGTCAWADPVHNLVFVFLSNRIHPFVKNRKIIREDVRTSIQDIVYESINGFGKPIEMGR